MPGLHNSLALMRSFAQTKEIYAASVLNESFAASSMATSVPSIPLSVPAVVAIGAAAAVIKNPQTTRRGLMTWGNRFAGLKSEMGK